MFLVVTAQCLAQQPPSVSTQPQSCTNVVGTTAMFAVGATGTEPLAYQWQKLGTDFTDLADRTNATLVLTNVQTSDEADYRVAVSNVDGATNSTAAHLYVIVPPRITKVTNYNASVSLGAPVRMQVWATGTAPLSYQWWFGSLALAGKTTAILNLTNVQTTDAGLYTVVVTNWAGPASTNVSLDVDPTFTKITTGGVATSSEQAASFTWWDYDNDNFLDLFICNTSAIGGAAPDACYHNNGDGTFSRLLNTGLQQPSGSLKEAFGSAPGDFDNDGNLDLFVARPAYIGNNLFRNVGSGRFVAMTRAQAGSVASDAVYSYTAAWGDYDNDGFLDLFVANYDKQNDFLYRNDGTGKFTKMTTVEVGLVVADQADSTGCAWADYDNDGYVDLFVGNAGGTSFLYHNNHQGGFTRVVDGSIVAQAGNGTASGGTWADYDNDGFLDLYLAQGTKGGSLHRNLGGHTFTNVTASAGVMMPVNGAVWVGAWGDYDNDGYLDLFVLSYQGTNTLFHNNGDGTFASLNVGSPLTDGNRDACPGWADYDNDGFLDLFIACGNGQAEKDLLYHNNGNRNGWLKVKLVGLASNRSGIGAKVRVQATINGKTVRQMREISGSNAADGGSGLLAHFGLGDATNVDVLRIEWPSGIVQELTNLVPKQFLTITEQQKGVTQAPSLAESRLADGTVQLSLTGQTNLLYAIEASTNLVCYELF
jgi:hypothetical protein